MLISKLLQRMHSTYVIASFVWTSTKNEWNAQNAIWSWALRPSITRVRNVITPVLTTYHEKRARCPALEQKRFGPSIVVSRTPQPSVIISGCD